MNIDVSLILCLHKEGKYLLRTLRSLREAASFAQAEGMRVELIAVLDRPDADTRRILNEFDLSGFDHGEVLEVDNGSLGLSRNDGCSRALGKYFILCDGDDLVSFTYVHSLFCEAERHGPYAIVVPEWVMDFGGHYCVTQYSGLDVVTPLAFLDVHPYISRTCFHRQLHQVLKFLDVRLTAGYAYEDWHFNASAVALGYTFHVAPEAILFYRIRNGSLLRLANGVSVKQIPPSILFEPETFLRVCSSSVQRLRMGRLPKPKLRGKRRIGDPSCQQLIAAANRIEPAIEPKYLRDGSEWFPANASNLAIGRAYFEICGHLVGRRFSHVFLFPHFGIGGAERYFANLIGAIRSLRPADSMLIILGEPHGRNDWLDRLAPGTTVVDLAPYLSSIGPDGIDLLMLKLIQSCAPAATLHIRQSAFAQRFFEKFGRALRCNKRLFYCFGEEIRLRGEFGYAQPWSFSFISENFEDLDGVISDNRHIGRVDRERIGMMAEKWKFLPTLYNPSITLTDAMTRASQPSTRVLWASRLSWQKRPSLIAAIASRLHKARPELHIDVFGGHPVEFDPSQLRKLPNVTCHGPYDDFASIAGSSYLCFLYTSYFDGIPTVVLEAAGAGIPIVAPDVPAIGELVVDGETGILLASRMDDAEMADAYVSAVIKLADDPDLRMSLASAAYNRAVSCHGTKPYIDAVLEILGDEDVHRAA